MGVFRFSAALIEWSESELNDVKRLCVQAYKNAWHLPQSTASALFIFPKTHAGDKLSIFKTCRRDDASGAVFGGGGGCDVISPKMLSLTCLLRCSLHAGIQMSPDEVVGSHDGCRHSIAKALLICPCVSSGKSSVLAPRCSRALFHNLQLTSDRCLI